MDANLRLKRLIFRSCHRGNKEMDIVFSRFVEGGMEHIQGETLDVFEQLLDENDVDIWDWITGKTTPANPAYEPLLTLLKEYSPNPNA